MKTNSKLIGCWSTNSAHSSGLLPVNTILGGKKLVNKIMAGYLTGYHDVGKGTIKMLQDNGTYEVVAEWYVQHGRCVLV